MHEYFIYKGKYYGIGTIIQVYNDNHVLINVKFTNVNGSRYNFASVSNIYYCSFINHCLSDAIVSIVEPVYVNIDDGILKSQIETQSSKTGYIDCTIGWIWYVIAMVASLLFKDWLIAWAGITLLFIIWKINKLRRK